MKILVPGSACRSVLCLILLLPFACSSTSYAQAPEYKEFPQPDTPPPTDIGALVYIPGGTFTMGAPEGAEDNPLSPRMTWITPARPAHKETVPPFYVGKYPVTAKEYCECLNEVVKREPAGGFREFHHDVREKWDFILHPPSDGTKYTEAEEHGYVYIDQYSTVVFQDGKYVPKEGYELAPAMHVPYVGARRYCEWLSEKTGEKYRLPTEVEWEFVARGTEGRMFPWGDESPEGRIHRMTDEWQNRKWKPLVTCVGRSPRAVTPEGVHDMVRGAFEWCGNYYYEYSETGITSDKEGYQDYAEPGIPGETRWPWHRPVLTVYRGGGCVDRQKHAIANGWTRFGGGEPSFVDSNGTSFRVLKEYEK